LNLCGNRTLLDRTRRGLAIRYLADPTAVIFEVAILLGFSEPSAFHRAFKRWTGHTPRQFQRLGGGVARV
jgi:AraC-like DNA-binding protein